MSDNFLFDPGTTTTAAADDVSGVLYPRVKLTMGADGAADMDLDSGQQTMVNSLPVAIASNQTAIPINDNSGSITIDGSVTATAIGDVASGSTDSGNPVKFGGVAGTFYPSAVSSGQRINALFDKVGKQVVVGSIRDLKGIQQTAIGNTTSETTIVSAVASTFLDLYGVILANSSVTATNVTIKDATSGTTRAVIYVPGNDTRGFMLPESGAIPQAAVNNNWTATCSAAVGTLFATALYVKNI